MSPQKRNRAFDSTIRFLPRLSNCSFSVFRYFEKVATASTWDREIDVGVQSVHIENPHSTVCDIAGISSTELSRGNRGLAIAALIPERPTIKFGLYSDLFSTD